MTDMDLSELVEKLINDNLKEFYVSRRGRAGEATEE
jgi:hypothetical protein